MGKSRARKQREHLIRQGKRDPQGMRGSWGDVKPVTRLTPTLRLKKEKGMAKHKSRHSGDFYSFVAAWYFSYNLNETISMEW